MDQGLEPLLTNRVGLYPMRIHSLFSTIADALTLLEDVERRSLGSLRHDMIVVTRLDMWRFVHFQGRFTTAKKERWWSDALK
jgi:hypothetical protein